MSASTITGMGSPHFVSRAAAGGLPAEPTRFVGRSRELKQLTRLLTNERLITLTGAGGAGKSRLAIQAATRVRSTFTDGVIYVSLADLQDGELLYQLVGEALGYHGSVHRWTAHTVVAHLGESRRLLVLDNCEHLIGVCAELIEAVLHTCTDVTVLATSREPVMVLGENAFPILPLEVPGPDCALEAFGLHDAVRLFVERAVSVVPEFAVNEANHRAVAELCRRLDGLPLALELAAVRLRALSLDQILGLLSARPELLDGGRRGGPARQRTLSASMSWSYDLCSPAEQLLWARLSVFSGGVEIQAAEGICADDELPVGVILPLLTALVDKSILIREEHSGRVRFRLLETVRQFGLSRLDGRDDDVTAWRRRHCRWYVDIVEQTMSGWRAPGHPERLSMLRSDVSNLRAALEFCAEHPQDAAVGLQMASSLYHYWLMSGLLGEGSYWLDRLLAAVGESEPVRARGLYATASLAILRGDLRDAERMLGEAEDLCQRHGDKIGSAYVVQALGLKAFIEDDTALASSLLAESVQTLDASGDHAGATYGTVLYCIMSMLSGESDRLAEAHERCREMTVPYDESWMWSFSLWAMGMDAWNRGDLVTASETLDAALRLKRPLQDLMGIAECIEGIAWVMATSNKLQRAAVLLGAAETAWESMGLHIDTIPGFNRHRQNSAKVARTLGERPFQAAHRQGRLLDLDEAIAFALDEARAEPGSPDATKPTKRELQIAELVAQGRSNQSIADELMLSRRTVEAHIQHLLAKLGFNSRSQVAAWVAQRNAALDR